MRLVLGLICALVLAPATYSAPDLGVPSKDGLVVCTSTPACDAGASVLARGGNAVDAAVETAFALAVTHPSAGNIGGGGLALVCLERCGASSSRTSDSASCRGRTS